MAQNLAVCQFCEVSNHIKWKCINCDLILCEGCNTQIHTKIKTSDKHSVIDLKEINDRSASETIRTSTLHNIPCSIHAEENFIIYCLDCDTLVCSSCLIDSHTNHKLSKLSTSYTEKVQELKKLEEKLEEVFPLICEQEKEIDKVKVEKLEKYNQIKQVVFDRERDVKEEVVKQTRDVINQLDDLCQPQMDLLDERYEGIRKEKDKISKQKAQIEEVFLSHDAVSVFKASNTVSQEFSTKSPAKLPLLKDTILLQTNTTATSINLGSIISVPRLKIMKTFTSDLRNIFKLKCLKDDTIITTALHEKVIHKNKLQDEKFISSKIVAQGCDVVDMTITVDGKLLFSLFKNSEVKFLSNFETEGKSEVFLSVSPFHVRGIHASNKNIYIGFKDNGSMFSQEKERRGILIYNNDRTHMRTIKFDTNNEMIFSLPEAITTNSYGDICVVDCTDCKTWEGRVAVLSELGKVRWTYSGHPAINSKVKFTPFDILSYDELLHVTDRDSNALHVLSMDGDLVTSLIEKDGIERPFSVDIDKSGQLLIGTDGIKSNNNKAKLYIVKLNDNSK